MIARRDDIESNGVIEDMIVEREISTKKRRVKL